MAEVIAAIASGITLASLFKACIEAFDLIQTGRHQEADFKKLKLRLDIEKCRLYIWGEALGLTDSTEARPERPIDRLRFLEVVRKILELVIQLFHDSQKIRDKYGCRRAALNEQPIAAHGFGPTSNLAAAFANFSVRASPTQSSADITQSVTWVIHDRKKFGGLVAEIKELIDSLQGITSPCVPLADQTGVMRHKIVKINDSETLSLIADVCSEDHRDISEAASTKADTMSMASTDRQTVAAWTEDVHEPLLEVEQISIPDLESLTVTELKHKLFEMMEERRSAEARRRAAALLSTVARSSHLDGQLVPLDLGLTSSYHSQFLDSLGLSASASHHSTSAVDSSVEPLSPLPLHRMFQERSPWVGLQAPLGADLPIARPPPRSRAEGHIFDVDQLC